MFGIEVFEKEKIQMGGVNCLAISGMVYTPEYTTLFFISLSARKYSLYKLKVDDHRAIVHILNNIHTLVTY